MTIRVITNLKPRWLRSFDELPARAQKELEHLNTAALRHEIRVVQYRGEWYDVWDSQHIIIGNKPTRPMGHEIFVAEGHPFADWSLIVTESYHSGLLFRFAGHPHAVVVGRFDS